MIGMRDTKDRDGGTLAFSRRTWATFLEDLKEGTFDL
jgi:hypothetical protein